jgi:hypothetical protein
MFLSLKKVKEEIGDHICDIDRLGLSLFIINLSPVFSETSQFFFWTENGEDLNSKAVITISSENKKVCLFPSIKKLALLGFTEEQVLFKIDIVRLAGLHQKTYLKEVSETESVFFK